MANAAGDRDYDFVLSDVDGSYPTTSGWYDEYKDNYTAGRFSLQVDSTAPYPEGVLQMIYPKGYSGGTSPGTVTYRHRVAGEYYIGFFFKISKPYQNVSSNHNKIAYLYAESGRDIVFEFFGPEPYHFGIAEYVSDSAGAERDHWGKTPLELANWYKVEIAISYETGTITWWVNGAEDATFPASLHQTGGRGLVETQFSPTYGGGGLPVKPESDYVWYNHVHMSGVP